MHSGDSIALYPAQSLSAEQKDTLVQYTTDLGRALGVRGLFNIQYVVFEGTVYVIEVNPRGSRTVPFLSKVTGVPMVDLAVRVGLGQCLEHLGFDIGLWPDQPLVAAKAPVFSMSKLTQVDTYLGPEMKSTGEVMGLGQTGAEALGKALLAAGHGLPGAGSAVLLSLADRDKDEAMPLIARLAALGYDLMATEGTAARIRLELGLPVERITKMLHEGHPNVVDALVSGRVGALVNTVTGDRRPLRDGFLIRRTATERRIPPPPAMDSNPEARGPSAPWTSTVPGSAFRVPRLVWMARCGDGQLAIAPHWGNRRQRPTRNPRNAGKFPITPVVARDTRPGGAYSWDAAPRWRPFRTRRMPFRQLRAMVGPRSATVPPSGVPPACELSADAGRAPNRRFVTPLLRGVPARAASASWPGSPPLAWLSWPPPT